MVKGWRILFIPGKHTEVNERRALFTFCYEVWDVKDHDSSSSSEILREEDYSTENRLKVKETA
jgi:hypothetical protein